MTNLRANYYEFTTEPAGEVVSLDFVKQNANITWNDDDAQIQIYIDTAVERIANATNRILQPAQVDGFYPYPDSGKFNANLWVPIQRAPIRTVDAVAVWDETLGDYSALTVGQDYAVEKKAGFWRVVFSGNVLFNRGLGFDDLQPYPIRVSASVGYADSDSVPTALRVAVAQYATFLWENRGDCSGCEGPSVGGSIFPQSIFDLISPYIIRRTFG